MKICITGATGYIGSLLSRKLVNEGNEVHALVRSKEKATIVLDEKITLFEGDLLNKDSLRNAMNGCSHVYHLAALAKVWTRVNDDFFNINVMGTKNVLETAIENQVERVVVCSTAGVLGASFNGEISEESTRECDFFNTYESSKTWAELMIKDYVIQEKLDIVIASPTRVYGPYLTKNPESVTLMIERYVNKKWRIVPGSGKKIGNYIYVDDVVKGLSLAMEKGRNGHTYILGGSNHDLIDFFELLKKVSSVDVKMYNLPIWAIMLFARFQYLLAYGFNITPLITPKWVAKTTHDWKVSSIKAQDELGLKITPLEIGLKETVEWLKEQDKF